ncbi:MAG: hypothetical protein ABIV13_04540 [Fimbriimonadales bacterium]
MRRLKVLTTVLLILGICVLLSYPFTVGAAPSEGSDKADVKAFLIRLTLYFGTSTFAMLAAAFCAALIVKRAKKDFAEKKLTNLEELLIAQTEALRKNRDAE